MKARNLITNNYAAQREGSDLGEFMVLLAPDPEWLVLDH
jgi:hypothetical protein